MQATKFQNAFVIITNGWCNFANVEGKQHHSILEMRLRAKIEKVLMENHGQILIPCSSKSKILELLQLLENLFQTNQRF
jgi:Cft2 family RNA processing exonuclease